MFKEGKIEKIIGLSILALIIIVVIIVKINMDKDRNLTLVYGAVGGGKEDFLADEEVNDILAEKYDVKFVGESWSNGKLVKVPVVRDDNSKYDLIFFSDQRFYDYYKLSPNKEEGEADRDYVVDGGLTLNTPIVIYSWDVIVDA